MKDLDRLGEDVRDALGRWPDRDEQARRREVVLLRAGRSLEGRSRRRRALALALPLAAAAILVPLGGPLLRQPAAPVRPWLLAGGRPVASDSYFAQAPANLGLDLDFADGSALHLSAGGRGHLVRDAGGQVLATLEQGEIEARIRPGERWIFHAGPISARVIGTRFRLAWQPDLARARLELSEGKVRVSGAGAHDLLVTSGQRLEADTRANSIKLSELALADREVTPAESLTEESAPAPTARRHARVHASETAASWKKLAAAGDHPGALAAAKAPGFGRLLETLDRADLDLLADSARLARDAGRAHEALLVLRRRFAGSREAAMAAFRLGRVALDLEHDSRAAAAWYETYLRESPGGPLAADARARLIQIRLALGDRDGARSAARDYLLRHPEGPQAGSARALLGGR